MRSRTDRAKLKRLATVVNKALGQIQEIIAAEPTELEQIKAAIAKFYRQPEAQETYQVREISATDVATFLNIKLATGYSSYMVGRALKAAGYVRTPVRSGKSVASKYKICRLL